MNYFKSFFMRYWYYFIIGILLFSLLSLSLLFYFKYEKKIVETPIVLKNDNENANLEILCNNEDSDSKLCAIDIKGAVKKPGVYELECNKNINDAIKMAGGKTKNAYTDNINLSKSITNEMVIYIYTSKEIKDKDKKVQEVCVSETIYIDSCKDKVSSVIVPEANTQVDNVEDKNNEENIIISGNNDNNLSEKKELISLNKASKEELMKLSGIGESKALNIIAYREKNNGFKTIEELKNVSGIGDAIFENIKSSITI